MIRSTMFIFAFVPGAPILHIFIRDLIVKELDRIILYPSPQLGLEDLVIRNRDFQKIFYVCVKIIAAL